jgi:hypothetical protein
MYYGEYVRKQPAMSVSQVLTGINYGVRGAMVQSAMVPSVSMRPVVLGRLSRTTDPAYLLRRSLKIAQTSRPRVLDDMRARERSIPIPRANTVPDMMREAEPGRTHVRWALRRRSVRELPLTKDESLFAVVIDVRKLKRQDGGRVLATAQLKHLQDEMAWPGAGDIVRLRVRSKYRRMLGRTMKVEVVETIVDTHASHTYVALCIARIRK